MRIRTSFSSVGAKDFSPWREPWVGGAARKAPESGRKSACVLSPRPGACAVSRKSHGLRRGLKSSALRAAHARFAADVYAQLPFRGLELEVQELCSGLDVGTGRGPQPTGKRRRALRPEYSRNRKSPCRGEVLFRSIAPNADWCSPGLAWRTAANAALWIGVGPVAARPAQFSVTATEDRRAAAILKK